MTTATPSVWDDVENEPDSPDCPAPGIYENISFEDYCQWNAVNHSRLCRIDKSPRNYLQSPDFSRSSAIRLGQLVHCGHLEPASVCLRYAVMPAYELEVANTTADGKPSTSTATAYVKDRRKQFTQMALDLKKTIVSQAEYQAYESALDAIATQQHVVDMVNSGRCEVSIVWHDRHTGLRCKARLDCVAAEALLDLKTSRDDDNRPLPESFEYSLWKYSYYTQAAWYQEGWRALTGDLLPFWFAVVGTGQPMQCVAAPVGEMTLRLGRDTNHLRLSKVAHCKESGEWPGYASPELFELPERYFPDEVTV